MHTRTHTVPPSLPLNSNTWRKVLSKAVLKIKIIKNFWKNPLLVKISILNGDSLSSQLRAGLHNPTMCAGTTSQLGIQSGQSGVTLYSSCRNLQAQQRVNSNTPRLYQVTAMQKQMRNSGISASAIANWRPTKLGSSPQSSFLWPLRSWLALRPTKWYCSLCLGQAAW